MKLAIVGCRNVGPLTKTLGDLIGSILEKYNPDLVISGGSIGIDQYAAYIAKLRGFRVKEYLPEVTIWDGEPMGKVGFKQRNLQIAQACDMLVRIAVKGAKTYGSGWTKDQVALMGKPTEEFLLNL